MRRLLAVTFLAASLTATACSATEDAPASGPATPTATPSLSASPAAALPDDSVTGGFTSFYDPGSSADEAARQLAKDGRDEDAALIKKIADQPIGVWLGNWTFDPTLTMESITNRAALEQQIPIFIVYNIPGRDCGLYSAGGLPEDQYLGWVQKLADGIVEGSVPWFILEPDALPQLGDCEGQGDRVHLLSEAARILDEAGGRVFLDVGHSNWNPVELMAERVELVGTEHLAGFATNTSNYNATENEVAWGTQLSELTGLPFITDTSRNGNGAPEDGAWCNPRGRALGTPPQILDPDGPLIAYVWGKVPGESDGDCNGGPIAGKWWEDVALELARNASS